MLLYLQSQAFAICFLLSVVFIQRGGSVHFLLQALDAEQIDLIERAGVRLRWILELLHFRVDLLKVLI